MRTLLYILFLVHGQGFCQALTETTRVVYKSDSHNDVILYAAEDCAHCYYYLPVDFRISSKSDGKPEASLVMWKNDNESEIIGAVLHVLTNWGLTTEREKNTQAFLRLKIDSLGTLMGPSILTASPEAIVIEGDDKLAKILRSCLSNEPLAPVMPGSKTAFSFRFNEDVIKDLLYYLKNPAKTNTSLVAYYSYEVTSGNGMVKRKTLTMSLGFKEILELIKNSK